MNRWLLLLVSLSALLAGCLAPEIPEDASTATYEGLEGPILYGWIRDDGPYIVFHGAFHQDSDRAILMHEGHRSSFFNLTLYNETGEWLLFDSRLSCREYFYDHMQAGTWEEYIYSWDQRIYLNFEKCQDGSTPDYVMAPAGNYTMQLEVHTRDYPDDAWQVQIPFTVA